MQQLTINILLLISSILGSYLYMSWTTEPEWDPIINFFYQRNDPDSLREQFEIIVTTGYYLILVFILGFASLQCYKYAQKRKNIQTKQINESLIVKTVNLAFINTFYELVTFMCLYFYFIRQHQNDVSEKQLILIPFWFTSSRIFYLIGYLMTSISGVNLKHYGQSLTVFTYVAIIGQSMGYNLFQLL